MTNSVLSMIVSSSLSAGAKALAMRQYLHQHDVGGC
jgi:hypothetical protein